MCCMQLNEMRSQLELRDSQIHELKRLYRESREAEARNAEVVQQLRVELASHHNIGMIDTNCGDLQRQNRELQDHITQLQSQLRSVYYCLELLLMFSYCHCMNDMNKFVYAKTKNRYET